VVAETKTKSGILLPESSVQKMNEGEVVASGPGVINPHNGALVPNACQVGDKVLLPEYGGNEVKLTDGDKSGEEYVLYRDSDILGKF